MEAVVNILVAILLLQAHSQETPVSDATPFLQKVMPFVRKAEKGIMSAGQYDPISESWIRAFRITDLNNTFRIALDYAALEYQQSPSLVTHARLRTVEERRNSTYQPYSASAEMDREQIEPLINSYATTAGFGRRLEVTSARLSQGQPISFEVRAVPTVNGVPFGSNCSARFQIDYRHGRLIEMSLYGYPIAPSSLSPAVSLENARIRMIQRIFERYSPTGVVDNIEVHLVIWGEPNPVANDDAVKYGQRLWNVQGKLAYEATFDHIATLGQNQIPSRFYRAVVDATSGEIVLTNEFEPGGGRLGDRNKSNAGLEGRIVVLSRKGRRVVTSGNLKTSKGSVSERSLSVQLIGKNRAIRGEFDPNTGLIKAGGQILKPSPSLLRALKKLS